MEAEYRKRVQQVFDRIESSFESVDPDVVECNQSMGSLTLVLADQSRCILSAQPSVQQLWLALASRGTAYHFNFDDVKKSWLDDKGRGIEIFHFLETYLKEATGTQFKLTRQATLYTMKNCPFCLRAKQLLTLRGVSFQEILVPEEDDEQWDRLFKLSGMRTMPQIFSDNQLIGGYSELAELDGQDQLVSLK